MKYLRGIKSPIIFDIGAHIGDYSIAALKANKNSKIHCFEPSESHLNELKVNLRCYDVKINPYGLSNEDKKKRLFKDKEISGLKSLVKRDLSHISIQNEEFEIVNLRVGDNYIKLKNLDKINLIKIDVEGWEMEVLKGFTESLKDKRVDIVQFEFGHAHIENRLNFRDFYKFFRTYDYVLGALKPNGKINYIKTYDEIHENYYCTNYLALSRELYKSGFK